MFARAATLAVVLGCAFHGSLALAQEGTEAASRLGSDTYEERRVARALRARGHELDPHPAGKRIAFIEVVREDVLAEDEIWPTWPNAFHWLTDETVVRRELLLSVGATYDADRLEESARNLRALRIFALVRIVAVRAAEPGEIGLVVYTRDLWSLRLEVAFEGASDTSFAPLLSPVLSTVVVDTDSSEQDTLTLGGQLVERNLFGRNKQFGLSFGFDPKTVNLGETYSDPRVFGHRLALNQDLSIVFNRSTGEAEGSYGGASFGRPFYKLDDRFAWTAVVDYWDLVVRSLVGNDIRGGRPLPDGTVEDCVPERDADCLRRVYDSRRLAASLAATYRHGERYKLSYSAGFAFNDRHDRPNAETRLEAGQEEAFARMLRPPRRDVYPFVSYGVFLPRYARFQNLATFGRVETVRVGPSGSAQLGFPLRAFGSSTDSMTARASAGYVLASHDALAELSVATATRLQDKQATDQSITAFVRGATPPWLVGRLVLHGSALFQQNDSDRSLVSLGGTNGLRGYSAGQFGVYGGSRVLGNVEYRTLPLDVLSVHVGAVAFYDVGGVYNATADFEPHHAAGLGLRVLFPQFNRYVFRADFGVPLDEGGFSVQASYGTSQAILLTDAEAE